MIRKTFCSSIFAAGLMLIGANAWSHHSAAGYNTESRIMITGVVSKAAFRNPHGSIKIAVSAKNDQTTGSDIPTQGVEEWEVETAAANLLRRRGWDFKAVKPGMELKLVGHPTKDGSHMIYLREIHMPDGTVMGDPEGKDKALD